MSNLEEATRWLKQGERDLGAAMVLMDKEFYESACFHAQQASEKGTQEPAFHEGTKDNCNAFNTRIIQGSQKVLPEFKDLGRASMELDKHYIPPRYPDAFPSGSPFEYYTERMQTNA